MAIGFVLRMKQTWILHVLKIHIGGVFYLRAIQFWNSKTISPQSLKKKFIPPLKSYYFILLPNDIGSLLQNFVAITLNQKSYNKKFVIAQCGVSIIWWSHLNFLLFITRLLRRSCGILYVYWAYCNLVCNIFCTNTTDCT